MSVSIKVSKTFTETQSLIPDQAPAARKGGKLEQDQVHTERDLMLANFSIAL